jgi:hypothetical protein
MYNHSVLLWAQIYGIILRIKTNGPVLTIFYQPGQLITIKLKEAIRHGG